MEWFKSEYKIQVNCCSLYGNGTKVKKKLIIIMQIINKWYNKFKYGIVPPTFSLIF